MKYLIQFLIIIAFSFAGELLHHFIPLPVPASIYGIVLLFAALELKLVKVSAIKQVSAFLIEAMPVMFLPPAVGVLQSWGIIKGSLWQYVTIMTVSTFVVMAVSAWTTQAVIRLKNKKEAK